MATIIDLMLAVRKDTVIFYHKDTKEFDYFPVSAIEMKNLSPDARKPLYDSNNYRFLSYNEINHEETMRFFVREYVEDKEIRKQLFYILRRDDYIDTYLDKLREFNLYDDFIDACGDLYSQLFEEWEHKNGLDLD